MDNILQFDNLRVSYGAENLALDGVSLSVERGSVLVIVGESGSGKSTLIRSVLGLLPPGGAIRSGKILFMGEDLSGLGPAQLRKLRGSRIALIFQDARSSFNPKRKIGSQFIESLRSHTALSVGEARRIALTALADVHMPNPAWVMNAYAFELSGGMCQRVALAMAISEYAQPALLLADEPTSSLDVTIQAQVIRQMLDFRERYGTSIVLVTHNFGVAAYMADHIAVMRGGRLIEWGERDRVILRPQHEYTETLLGAVPRMEVL